MAEIRPDILIPYNCRKAAGRPVIILAVRPETNRVGYEATLVRAVHSLCDSVYMANLSGRFMNEKAVTLHHYATQLRFAVGGKVELERYPEMVGRFENYFKTSFEKAKIVGAYDAILVYGLKKDADELFETMVPREDLLEFYGQTIKKIGEYFVVNYDIPAVVTRHGEHTDIFVTALLPNEGVSIPEINRRIYDTFMSDDSIKLLDEESRQDMAWYDRVRRTYHLSKSHVEAMFDLTDFVFNEDGTALTYDRTPLGNFLVSRGVFSSLELQSRMESLKENPLVISGNGKNVLINILEAAKARSGDSMREKDFEQCLSLIKSIVWED